MPDALGRQYRGSQAAVAAIARLWVRRQDFKKKNLTYPYKIVIKASFPSRPIVGAPPPDGVFNIKMRLKLPLSCRARL